MYKPDVQEVMLLYVANITAIDTQKERIYVTRYLELTDQTQ